MVAHYAGGGGLVDLVRRTFEDAGVTVDGIPTTALAPLDEFHVRGRAATLEVAAALDVTAASRVLDLGSGLGGPARTLAETVGCRVTGVDLTPEYVDLARALSQWTGLADRTSFVVGDATDLGFEDDAFDAVMTVHAAMNIPDKRRLYDEARRVLRPGGRFVAYDVVAGDGGDPVLPVPFARDPATSHLVTTARMRDLLVAAGFEVLAEADSSAEGLAWFAAMRERLERSGPPPITFQAFLGDDFPAMARNQVTNLAEDRIRTVLFACRNPA